MLHLKYDKRYHAQLKFEYNEYVPEGTCTNDGPFFHGYHCFRGYQARYRLKKMYKKNPTYLGFIIK